MAKHGKKRDGLNYEKNELFLAAREARPKAVRLSNGHPKLNSQSILIGIAYAQRRHRIRNPQLVILY